MNKQTVNIITLGCSKNTVDSEQLAAKLQNSNFEVYHNSEDIDFDIAIVNTCGFIQDAKEQSIEIILGLVDAKKNNSDKKHKKKIIVFGCLAERYYEELKKEIPEVDVFLGNYNLSEILDVLEVENKTKSFERIFEDEGIKHYAYLKIAEGCNRQCSFCAIPKIKGKYVSRPIDDILEEAKFLAKNNVKELLIIAQDICYYGYDLEQKYLLPELIEKISQIEGIEWIRLHYLYPFNFPEELIPVIKNNPKVCKYIDIPLQHISDNVLSAMKRGNNKKQTVELLEKIRKEIPDIAIRTTLLIGHPGETEGDYKELYDFVKKINFDRLGIFPYSPEEDTYAYKNYKDEVSDEIKTKRADEIMEMQNNISFLLNQRKIGKNFKVIIDYQEDDYFVARTEFDSPDVDNEVIIYTDKNLKIGNFYNVTIVDATEFELIAEL